MLEYPCSDDTFILDTDASNIGIGGILLQVQDSKERVIAYASKKLDCRQQRYSVTRRELLAAVTFMHQFRHYFLGRWFILRTDHNSLRWLFEFKDPQVQLARWIESLSQYSFTKQRRPGTEHINADTLSRNHLWLLKVVNIWLVKIPILTEFNVRNGKHSGQTSEKRQMKFRTWQSAIYL